jgi:hypothetical protein
VLVAASAAACGSSSKGATQTANSCPSGSPQTFVTGLPGYQVCLFAASTTSYSHPDSVVVDGQNVYVGFQNITAKDGADHKTSTIVQYDLHGTVLKKFTVGGHQDGLRMDPTTHLLWSLSDEDGNPLLYTVDPASGTVTPITLPPTPHGGGFDDVVFVNGSAFIDASNPTLNSAGINVFPALYKVTLTGNAAKLTPVLMGNGTAENLLPPVQPTTLNLIDPDSMTVDPNGNLLLDNQGGSQLLFIHNPGTPQQTVKQLPVGTQVDDTVFPTTSTGCIVVSDNGGAIYSVCSTQFVPGTAYTATPNDSGVQGFIGTISLGSGFITPLVVGLANPHGLGFVPGVTSL